MSNTNLPWISSNIPPDLRQFLERVREQLGGNEYVRRVDYLNRTIPRNPTDPVDPTPPPIPNPPCGSPVTPTTPTGLEVAAGFEAFLLTWDMPGYCGHSHTEVYGLRRDGTSSELGPQHKLGESRGVMYSHVVNQPQDYWCFWIKHVNTLGTAGPFTGAGVCDKTALDPAAVIEVLQGQITETELYQDLGDRIDLIDGPLNLNGSVNSRVAAEALARETGIYNEASARTAADGALATQITAVVATADSNAAAIATETSARTTADGALATQITAVVAKADSNAAAIVSEASARANADGALGTRIDQVQAVANGNSSLITDITTARIGYCTKNSQTTADGTREACQANGGTWNVGLPWATAVKQVAVTYNGQTVALEQQFNAISTDTGNLKAQYSVKIDNNGYVSGFGLSSTPVNGVPYSDFIIRADRFSIGSPANPDEGYQTDPTIPFIVTTMGQTIGGEYVPPGTYIKDGYIQNGTITNAKIKNATIDSAKILTLSADKITGEKMRVGSYIASSSYNGTITGGRITAPGTTGWAIDSAGNAEFDYVHLRKGAVSSMSFDADPGGNTLPMSQLWVATENGAPKTYYKDERVSIREASGDVTTYRCLTTAVQKDPRYTSGYWTRDPDYDFVTLQQITTTGIDVTATTLGAVLFGRFQVYVDATLAPDNKYTGDEGDVVARLVRVDPSTGSLVTITQSGYPLAYCGRCRDPNKPNHYHYSAAIHSFVRRPSTDVDPGTTGSTYYMQARNITHPSTPLTTFSEGLGYIGARR